MKSIISAFHRLLFDNKCPACGGIMTEESEFICYDCNRYFDKQSLKKYENIYYIWEYDEKFKKIVEEFKFYGKKGIREYFGKMMGKKLEFVIKKEDIDIIVPVPIHKTREQERGFNQVEEILKYLKKDYIKVERKKNTKHMYEILSEDKRSENILHGFRVKKETAIIGMKVLIFDDIITTGSTIKELTNELKEAGALSVCSMVLAAAPFYKKSIIKREESEK